MWIAEQSFVFLTSDSFVPLPPGIKSPTGAHNTDKCESENKLCPHCRDLEHTTINISGQRERCEKQAMCVNCNSSHNSFRYSI